VNDIFAICPACKAVMVLPDADKTYNCIACEAHPIVLHTTDLFKVCGEIKEGAPGAKVRELMLALQSAIWKEMKDGTNSV